MQLLHSVISHWPLPTFLILSVPLCISYLFPFTPPPPPYLYPPSQPSLCWQTQCQHGMGLARCVGLMGKSLFFQEFSFFLKEYQSHKVRWNNADCCTTTKTVIDFILFIKKIKLYWISNWMFNLTVTIETRKCPMNCLHLDEYITCPFQPQRRWGIALPVHIPVSSAQVCV